MLEHAYTNFGGYFWMVAVAFLTYLVMTVVKKTFTPFTKKFVSNNKERRFINVALGLVLSALVGVSIGTFGNYLFATNVDVMWFIGGGLVANYCNLIYRKYKDADTSAFASAFVGAMKESNFDITEDDLPTLTTEIGAIVKAYADHNANSRKSKLHNVASGITASVEITEDEMKELDKAIDKLKSSGIDTTSIEKSYAQAKADGKVTVAEAANLKEVIRAIHNATNI